VKDSYSQYGEDLKISELLARGNFQFAAEPAILEIGAWWPDTFSNSRLFIDRGWRALLVEFSPEPVHKLLKEYGANPKVRIIQAAVTASDDTLLEFNITDDALSTNNEKVLETWRERGGYFGKMWVPGLSVPRLANQFGGNFDVVSIDTEGSSVDIAAAWIATGARPKVLCVEHDGRSLELMLAIQGAGYELRFTNDTNAIFGL